MLPVAASRAAHHGPGGPMSLTNQRASDRAEQMTPWSIPSRRGRGGHQSKALPTQPTRAGLAVGGGLRARG